MSKIDLFHTVQFNISTQFSSISSINKTLSGATTPGHSGSGNDGNEGVLRIPQSSSTTLTSLSDRLVSYPVCSLWGSYSSAEVQSAKIYSYVGLNASFFVYNFLIWDRTFMIFKADYCFIHESTKMNTMSPFKMLAKIMHVLGYWKR